MKAKQVENCPLLLVISAAPTAACKMSSHPICQSSYPDETLVTLEITYIFSEYKSYDML